MRQGDPKNGALWVGTGDRHFTSVPLDDPAANRQAQPYSMRLRRHKRVEYVRRLLRINSRPGVCHFGDNRIAVIKPGSHFDHSVAIRRGAHCFDGVVKQVVNDLVQLISDRRAKRAIRMPGPFAP